MNFTGTKNSGQPNERTNKATPTFPDENLTPNFTNYGKRRFADQGEKEDFEAGSKKVKTIPSNFNGAESRQKQIAENENRPIASGFNTLGSHPFNVKEEGMLYHY